MSGARTHVEWPRSSADRSLCVGRAGMFEKRRASSRRRGRGSENGAAPRPRSPTTSLSLVCSPGRESPIRLARRSMEVRGYLADEPIVEVRKDLRMLQIRIHSWKWRRHGSSSTQGVVDESAVRFRSPHHAYKADDESGKEPSWGSEGPSRLSGKASKDDDLTRTLPLLFISFPSRTCCRNHLGPRGGRPNGAVSTNQALGKADEKCANGRAKINGNTAGP